MTQGALSEQGIVCFPMEKETKIINWEQDFCTPQNSISG